MNVSLKFFIQKSFVESLYFMWLLQKNFFRFPLQLLLAAVILSFRPYGPPKMCYFASKRCGVFFYSFSKT